MKRTVAMSFSALVFTLGANAATIAVALNDSRLVAGASGSEQVFRVSVPTGTATLELKTAGGSGDCDLYFQRSSIPTIFSATYRSRNSGTGELISLVNPASGDWYLMVRGVSSFSAVTLRIAAPTKWDFSTSAATGVLPGGWEIEPGTSPSTLRTFQVTNGQLQIWTNVNTSDRMKLRTKAKMQTGLYEARVYVPGLSSTDPSPQNTIALFLIDTPGGCSNCIREIDVEIAYGTLLDRLSAGASAGQLLAYFNVQADAASSTPSYKRFTKIPSGWAIARIVLGLSSAGRYQLAFSILPETGSAYSPPALELRYGPQSIGTIPGASFWLVASDENIAGNGGASLPKVRRTALFDYVAFQ